MGGREWIKGIWEGVLDAFFAMAFPSALLRCPGRCGVVVAGRRDRRGFWEVQFIEPFRSARERVHRPWPTCPMCGRELEVWEMRGDG